MASEWLRCRRCVSFLSERRSNVCVALFEERIEESLAAFVEVARGRFEEKKSWSLKVRSPDGRFKDVRVLDASK